MLEKQVDSLQLGSFTAVEQEAAQPAGSSYIFEASYFPSSVND